MCDFHSICVRRDGAIAHIPGNSHSGAVKASGWRENDQMAEFRGHFFVECEWDGAGAFPGVDEIIRSEINEKQRRVIETHYTALAQLLADPAKHAAAMCFGSGRFAGEEYADVRWRVLISPICPKDVAGKLAFSPLHANGERIKSLDPRITSLEGNLVVEDGYEISAPALTKVGGYLAVSGSAKLDALVEVGGYLAVSGSAKLDALVEVGGYLAVSGSAKLDAPALTKVGGNLDVYGSAKLDALVEVGGNLDVSGSAKLDALVEVGGNLDVYGSAKLDAPALTKVGGYLAVSGSAKLDALVEVGGNLDVYGSAKLDAPALTKVGGYLAVYGSAKLDALVEVGGNLDVSGSAKLDALVEVGGNLDVSGSAKLDAPNLKRNGRRPS